MHRMRAATMRNGARRALPAIGCAVALAVLASLCASGPAGAAVTVLRPQARVGAADVYDVHRLAGHTIVRAYIGDQRHGRQRVSTVALHRAVSASAMVAVTRSGRVRPVAVPMTARSRPRRGRRHLTVRTRVAVPRACVDGRPARAPASRSCIAGLVPTSGVMLGAFAQTDGLDIAASTAKLEQQIGRPLRIAGHYYNWDDAFPGAPERRDARAGRLSMVTWWGVSLARITSGAEDAVIAARARSVKAFGRPVFLRWGAEMNGDWYAWSGARNGADPSMFVRAWQRIHDIFARAGVRNAIWVWAPNAQSRPGGTDPASWNNWRRYYPGDAYVDWVGIDGYNFGPYTGSWEPFGEIMGPVYADYAATKPIMIAETGSVEQGGDKAAWIDDARTWVKHHRGIRAFVWFDTNRSSSGIDWRIDSSPASLDAFRRLARDPAFGA
jgi:hypothetical protein